MDICTVAKESLVDIRDVKIDVSKSREERISDYIRQVKNPYCFQCTLSQEPSDLQYCRFPSCPRLPSTSGNKREQYRHRFIKGTCRCGYLYGCKRITGGYTGCKDRCIVIFDFLSPYLSSFTA